MKEQKGMWKKSGLITREVNREGNLHGKQGAGFRHETRSDDTDKEINSGSPFSIGTTRRLQHEMKDSMKRSVRPLPKNDDSLDGQLNNDQRSDRNVPEKMPRIEHHQGRNDESIKYNQNNKQVNSVPNNPTEDLDGGMSTKRAGIGKPDIKNG